MCYRKFATLRVCSISCSAQWQTQCTIILSDYQNIHRIVLSTITKPNNKWANMGKWDPNLAFLSKPSVSKHSKRINVPSIFPSLSTSVHSLLEFLSKSMLKNVGIGWQWHWTTGSQQLRIWLWSKLEQNYVNSLRRPNVSITLEKLKFKLTRAQC